MELKAKAQRVANSVEKRGKQNTHYGEIFSADPETQCGRATVNSARVVSLVLAALPDVMDSRSECIDTKRETV